MTKPDVEKASIIGMSDIPVDGLSMYHRNPRVGQADRIAESLYVTGQYRPIVVNLGTHTGRPMEVLAGNHTLLAALSLEWETIKATTIDVSDAVAARIVAADNRLADLGGYDDSALLALLSEIADGEDGLVGSGYDDYDLEKLIDSITGNDDDGVQTDEEDDVPEPPVDPVTKTGDVWLLGNHRIMCGDSTSAADVEKLMNGETASVLHADPPYGMGKDVDGVENDDLTGAQLDMFQMSWWREWRKHVALNGSAYIWGNALPLWRLWFVGGLSSEPGVHLRNEIVWDKGTAQGMLSHRSTAYSTGTERCLFIQLGDIVDGAINVNKADFHSGFKPLLDYMQSAAEKAGIGAKEVNRVTGVQMFGHWFTESQFFVVPEKHYKKLQQEYPDAFDLDYEDLCRSTNADAISVGEKMRKRMVRSVRPHFNNQHDAMYDVWEYPFVVGAERNGHATPKPVEMMERVARTSAKSGEVIAEPFAGSGSTLIGAHMSGRKCFTMEIQPKYVDVVCERFQRLTGIVPVLEESGEEHDFL